MHTYINYINFEKAVYAATGDAHYQQFKHLLPTVNILQRERFLKTLPLCESISSCSAVVEQGSKLPDNHYDKYLNYVRSRQKAFHRA